MKPKEIEVADFSLRLSIAALAKLSRNRGNCSIYEENQFIRNKLLNLNNQKNSKSVNQNKNQVKNGGKSPFNA